MKVSQYILFLQVFACTDPIFQSAEASSSPSIEEWGWRYDQPFSIKSYSDTQARNWPDWIDALCQSACDEINNLGNTRMEVYRKQYIHRIMRDFAISTGLFSRVTYEIFEIGNKDWEEPRFVGCKCSQDFGINTELHPYADWSTSRMPFIARTNNPVKELQKLGNYKYYPTAQWNVLPCFFYALNPKTDRANDAGYCNVKLMAEALTILRHQHNFKKYLPHEGQTKSLLRGLLEKCRAQQ